MALIICSCSKDDTPIEVPSLIGEWKLEKVIINNVEEQISTFKLQNTMQFYEATAKFSGFDVNGNNDCILTPEINYSYETPGDILKLTPNEAFLFPRDVVYTVTANRFTESYNNTTVYWSRVTQ